MPDTVRLRFNGQAIEVASGTTVAAAAMNHGIPLRRSVSGEARTALCGMGICFECRTTINGVPHQRACMIACEEGMEVQTDV